MINGLGVGDLFVLDIRYIPDEDLFRYYSLADLIVLPYRKIYQSGVLLMAMTFGVPVVASNIPGMCEIVVDQENGLLFKSGDFVSLAEKIDFAIQNPNELIRYSCRAKLLLDKEYSWDGIGEQTVNLYYSISKTGS